MKVFQGEPGVLRSSFPADLTAECGNHRTDRDGVFTPGSECRRSSRAEQRNLLAELAERVARDKEANDALFLRQPLRFRPDGNVRQLWAFGILLRPCVAE